MSSSAANAHWYLHDLPSGINPCVRPLTYLLHACCNFDGWHVVRHSFRGKGSPSFHIATACMASPHASPLKSKMDAKTAFKAILFIIQPCRLPGCIVSNEMLQNTTSHLDLVQRVLH